MPATVDRPSAGELDQLMSLLESAPLDRDQISGKLHKLENALRQRRSDLDRAGGLLEDEDRASRMSLSREDDRLRTELTSLADDLNQFRQEVGSSEEDRQLRLRGNALLAGLRGHRDAEASLIIESAATEVGSGD